VGQQDFDPSQFRYVAGKRVAHLNGRGQILGALLQHLRDVLTGVRRTGKEQRDFPLAHYRHDAGGKDAGAFIGGLTRYLQHTHAGIVIVHVCEANFNRQTGNQHSALRSLPDQFIPGRLRRFGKLFHKLALRCRRQRYAEALLQALQPVEGKAAAILQQRDYACGASFNR
jgi:hypothetical protein